MIVMNQTISVPSLIKNTRAQKKIWARDCDFCKKSSKFLWFHVIFNMKKFFFRIETKIKSFKKRLGRQRKKFELNRSSRCRVMMEKVKILCRSGFSR